MCSVAMLTFFSCQQSTKDEPTIREELRGVISNENDTSFVDNPEENVPSLITEIDREKAHQLNASVSIIGTKIREILVKNENELSIEELLNQRITFTNNKGKFVNIPLSYVVDTVYIQHTSQNE